MAAPQKTPLPFVLVAIICATACQIAGMASGLLGSISERGWFKALEKPAYNPPAWVFGPVWSVLYLLMGVALAFIIRRAPAEKRKPLLVLFGIQMVLNLAWTPVFFGLHQITAALVIIVLLDLAVATLILRLWNTQRVAAVLLLPYLAWISFATYLNFAFWQLN